MAGGIVQGQLSEDIDLGGGGTQIKKNQASHGFNLYEPIYHNGSTWELAQADDAATLAEYIVIAVEDANSFVATKFGEVEAIGHGFITGEHYFLSSTVAGGAEISESTTWSSPLFYVEDANTLQIEVYRPSVSTSSPVFVPVENAVWGNGGGATGGDTSLIASVVFVDPHYRIEYVVGAFTAIPTTLAIVAQEVNNYTWVAHVDNESTTGCDVTIKGRRSDNIVFTNGSAAAWNWHISKNLADYTDPLVIAGAKTKWQTKKMTTTNTPSQMNYSGLTVGDTYELYIHGRIQAANNSITLAVYNGATYLGALTKQLLLINPSFDSHSVKFTFEASDPSITYVQSGGAVLVGGADETFATLVERKTYEQTSQW